MVFIGSLNSNKSLYLSTATLFTKRFKYTNTALKDLKDSDAAKRNNGGIKVVSECNVLYHTYNYHLFKLAFLMNTCLPACMHSKNR